jgi:hypothetical protein
MTMQKPKDFMIVNPSAKGSEPFALMNSEFLVDCLMNFEPEEREAVLRFSIANPYPDQAEREDIVANIMAMVKDREAKTGG